MSERRYELRERVTGRIVGHVHGALSLAVVRRVAQSLAAALRHEIEVRREPIAPATSGARAAGGRGRVGRARPRSRRNPSALQSTQAAVTSKRWRDDGAVDVVRPTRREVPALLVKLGELPEIIYDSDKFKGKTERYKHTTRHPRPLLCTGPDGRGLFIVGGRTRVTSRGLVD